MPKGKKYSRRKENIDERTDGDLSDFSVKGNRRAIRTTTEKALGVTNRENDEDPKNDAYIRKEMRKSKFYWRRLEKEV
jgi:hypothetical protein